ncbi:hypothetical protein PG985_003266 [Apiospora marii]|uniref:uncharacterized protein n=1 Tax=Apiospora marii TaxID=335849 RepID=UPI00312CD467
MTLSSTSAQPAMPSDNNSHISGSSDSDISAAAAAQVSRDLEDYYNAVYPDGEEEADRYRGGFNEIKEEKKQQEKKKGKGKKDDKNTIDNNSQTKEARHKDGYKAPPVNNQK